MGKETKSQETNRIPNFIKTAAFLIPILLCTTLLAITIINMINSFQDSQAKTNDYDNGYRAASNDYNMFLNTGLSILGIAISVWVGVNVYNVVERDQVNKLKKEQDRISKKLENAEKRNKEMTDTLENAKNTSKAAALAIGQFDKIQRSLLLASSLQYNEFPVRAIKSKILEKYEEDFLKNVSLDHYGYYAAVYMAIENNYSILRGSNSKEYRIQMGEKGLAICIKLNCEIELPEDEKIYLTYRIGEFYYYLAELYKNTDKEKSRDYYSSSRDYFLNANSQDSFLNKEGYIDQTIGSTYLLVQLKDYRKDDLNRALDLITSAIEKDKSQGVYFKNRGIIKQHLGKNIDEVVSDYHMALKVDETKGIYAFRNYIALASLLLNELQKTLGGTPYFRRSQIESLTQRLVVPSLSRLETEKSALEIEELYRTAKKYGHWDAEPYYKSAQLNICRMLYFAAIGDELDFQAFEKIADEDLTESFRLDMDNLSAKYQLRNFLAAKGNMEGAREINEQLKKQDPGGDAYYWDQ